MKTKICKKCKEEKDLKDFTKDKRRKDGVTNICLTCRNTKRRQLENSDKEKYKQKRKKYSKEKKEEISKQRKEYYQKNKKKFQDSWQRRKKNNPEKYKYYWRSEEHRAKAIRKSVDSYTKRLKTDGNLRMIKNLRSRLRNYLKQKGYKKEKGFFEIVGLSPTELKIYIEQQFKDEMCWEKMGKEIHIDHIIPLSSAKTKKELYDLCNYKNLQPLWAQENIRKSNNII